MFFCPIPCQRICMKVSDRARIITKAEVSRLLSRAGSVVGRSLRILIRLQLGVPTHRCPRLRVPEIWEKQQGVRSRHPLHWPPSCTADDKSGSKPPTSQELDRWLCSRCWTWICAGKVPARLGQPANGQRGALHRRRAEAWSLSRSEPGPDVWLLPPV